MQQVDVSDSGHIRYICTSIVLLGEQSCRSWLQFATQWGILIDPEADKTKLEDSRRTSTQKE